MKRLKPHAQAAVPAGEDPLSYATPAALKPQRAAASLPAPTGVDLMYAYYSGE